MKTTYHVIYGSGMRTQARPFDTIEEAEKWQKQKGGKIVPRTRKVIEFNSVGV